MKKLTTILLLLIISILSFSQTKELKNNTYLTKSITVYQDINSDNNYNLDIDGTLTIYDSSGSKYVKQFNNKSKKSFTVKIVSFYDKIVSQEGTLFGYTIEDKDDNKSKGILAVLYNSSGQLSSISIADLVSLIIYHVYIIPSL